MQASPASKTAISLLNIGNVSKDRWTLRSGRRGNICRMTIPCVIGEQRKCHSFFRIYRDAGIGGLHEMTAKRLKFRLQHSHEGFIFCATTGDDVIDCGIALEFRLDKLRERPSDAFCRKRGCGGNGVFVSATSFAACVEKLFGECCAEFLASGRLGWLCGKERMFQGMS